MIDFAIDTIAGLKMLVSFYNNNNNIIVTNIIL